MQEQIDRIEKKVDKIADSLTGNEFTDHKGMIDAVQQNTKFRRASIKRIGVVTGFSTAIGFMFGAAWTWIKTKLGM